MTPQQNVYYNQLVNYVISLKPQTKFCLDKNFYASALPNINLTAVDKQVLGREFKKDVQNKAIPVDFDYIFGGCTRCGYKDNANKCHYKTI